MKTINYNFWMILISVTIMSCDQFQYSHYQVDRDSKYKDLNYINIQSIKPHDTDTTRIIVLGDTQRFYKETDKLKDKINDLPSEKVDFIVHTGDLVDFGIQREYFEIHEMMAEMKFPYVAVVGNHDMIGNGSQIYNNMYGENNFSFIINGNKFIYVNTNLDELRADHHNLPLKWLNHELSDTSNYNQAIIVSHVAPHHWHSEEKLEKRYVNLLEKYGKTLLYINGHDHRYSFNDVYNNGLMFLNTFSTSKKKTVLVNIWNGGYKLEIVE